MAGDEPGRPATGERARRGLALLLVALVAVILAGGVYLRPPLVAPVPSPGSGPSPTASRSPRIGPVSFGDGRHGAVTLIDPVPAPFLTWDGGRTWKAGPRGAQRYPVLQFIGPHVVIGQTFGTVPAVEMSEDDGRTWRSVESPPAAGGGAGSASPVFLDSRRGWWLMFQRPPGGSLPAAGVRSSQPVLLWRTDDGGRTWRQARAAGIPDVGNKGGLLALDDERAVMPVTGEAGWSLYSTRDGGDTWERTASFAPAGPGEVAGYVTLLNDGAGPVAALYSTPASGLAPPVPVQYFAHSRDGGATWSRMVAGPTLSQQTSEAPRSDGRGRLAMLDGRRLWTSDDGGADWSARLVMLPEGIRPLGLVAGAEGVLWALAVDFSGESPPVVGSPVQATVLLRGDDDGRRWTRVALPPSAV